MWGMGRKTSLKSSLIFFSRSVNFFSEAKILMRSVMAAIGLNGVTSLSKLGSGVLRSRPEVRSCGDEGSCGVEWRSGVGGVRS